MGIIGEEWIVVRPETTGFIAKLKSSLLGGGSGGIAGVGNLVGASAVAGIGVGLFAVGEKFAATYNKIKVQTGATGKVFEGLKDDVKNVLGSTAGSFEQVGAAVGLLYTRTGLTGKALDDLAKQQVTLARITKTDVGANVDLTTKLFAKYGIAASDQGKQLDVLFKASQQAGVGITDIIQPMLKGGAALQQFGFGIDRSAALIASLTKAGVNVQPALMSLRSAFGKIAKEGGDPVKVLMQMQAALLSGKNPAKAMADAMALLGNRGGLELANAIKSGKFNLDAMVKTITDGKGGILQTGAEVSTLGGKFQLLKNQVLVAIEPIATKLVELANHYLKNIIDYVNRMGGLGAVFNKWKAPILAVVAALALWFAPMEAVIAGLILLYMKNETFRNGVNATASFIQTKLVPAFQAIAQWIVGTVVPALQRFVTFMVGTVWPAVQQIAAQVVGKFQELAAGVSSRWNDIRLSIEHVLMAIKIVVGIAVAAVMIVWRTFHNQILAVANVIWNYVRMTVQTAMQFILGFVDVVLGILSGHWGRAWNGIKAMFGAIWDSIIGTLQGAMGLLSAALSAALTGIISLVTFQVQATVNLFTGIGSKIIDMFKGAGSWLKDVGKQIVQGLIDGILSMVDQLSNAFVKLGSSIPGSGILSHLPGGKLFGGNARGGPVYKDQPGWVGEEGPEIFVPGQNGTIIPNNVATSRMSPAGGALTLVLAPNFPPGMDHDRAMAELKAYATETIADVVESVQSGRSIGSGTSR